ncbi:glycosyltransferase family 4 protein [Algibacter amylolyticus]|uniref:Glycosyltransferase family 4 protein n=1 Tax=Algibacter amylolyticus TaxID=1608400 RepID=A0A5M7BFU1_9FLAO|nr:glycosyltransferase [Algibacter amylolyticus]KAA5827418.1 glycosyltransferase family 4 protein [Algibacter amylolyticus]MBB5266610.1 glycosyltransferase involved in cell wall biosynthesis [Algibacter amylolyticus]TSJ81663.1 glycosyltransferase family 4 protein [Algibacter amylolyticus]
MTDLIVINDEPVNFHFPDHYKYVYLDLLKKDYNIETKMIVTEKGESSFNHKNILIKLKKSSTKSFLKRVFYSVYLMFSVFKTLMFNKKVKGVKYIMVHDEPIVGAISYLVCKIKGKKFIYRITHLKAEEVGQTPGFKYRILSSVAIFLRNTLLKKADAVIVMSNEMKRYFEKSIKRDMHVISSCIKLNNDVPLNDIPEEIINLKASITKNSLCYLGTISRFRGLSFIIDVMHNLHLKGFKKKLYIFGKGTEDDFIYLKNSIKDLKLEDYIYLHNQIPMDHLKYVIEEVRIGLSPYLFDDNYVLKYNSPLKTLDYMSFGKFVVGSDIDDHLETIINSNSGEVAPNKADDFSDAIIRLEKRLNKLTEQEEEEHVEIFSNWLKENRSLGVSAKKVYNVLETLS